ncbi:MAG: hypothetical protein KKB21_02750 [Nanoarchaeota archaeon]|nr:hypothetical protein [Nanoarchaeota archaeon]
MSRKSFFEERTVAEMQDMNHSEAYRQRGLVERIDGLQEDEGLIVRAQIIPGRFFLYPRVKTAEDASRMWLKYGDTIKLHYPETRRDSDSSPLTPLQVRAAELAKLSGMKEEEINFLGLSSRPEFGDRTVREFPFVYSPIGLRIFAYAEKQAGGIDVNVKYRDSARAVSDGVEVVVGVPSRSRRKARYEYKLMHVPVIRNPNNLAAVQLLRPQVIVDECGEPVEGRTKHDLWRMRYGGEQSEEGKFIVYQPQDVAAYIAIIKKESESHNLNPLVMNPFPIFSRRGAMLDKKLMNNVLIFDKTLSSKSKLRKPHLAERCVLLARAIGVFGHDEIAYWDPARDGKLRDYDWKVS